METEPLALRPREAAKALGISVRMLWSLTAPRGPIEATRTGDGRRAAVLYPVAGLKAFVAGGNAAARGLRDGNGGAT